MYEPVVLGPRVRSSQLYDACGNPLLLPAGKRAIGATKPPPRQQQSKPLDNNHTDNRRPKPILKKRDSSLAAESRVPAVRPPQGTQLKRSNSSTALLAKTSHTVYVQSRPGSPPCVTDGTAAGPAAATVVRRKPLVKSQSLENTAQQSLYNVGGRAVSAAIAPSDGGGPLKVLVPKSGNRKTERGDWGPRRGRRLGGEELREQDEELVEQDREPESPALVEPSKPKRLMKKLFQL